MSQVRIAVTRADGHTEVLTLNAPIELFEGTTMCHIHSAEGYDHYFQRDGFYDGWGLGAPDRGWTPEQGRTYIKQTESLREFVPLTLSRFIKLKLRAIWRRIYYWQGYLMQRPGYPPFPWSKP